MDNMWEYILTFVFLFFTDIFYTYYLKSIAEGKALIAGYWSVIVTVISAFVVINYTTNHYVLIPAALGAFCGTFAGIHFKKKMEHGNQKQET